MRAKLNQIKTIIFSLAILCSLTSCENFLKATDVKDYTVAQWESHAREIGTKQINFSADDHEERRYNIPSNLLQKGECYIVIAHFADDTVLTSKVMVW